MALHSVVGTLILLAGLVTGLTSGRPLRVELVAAAEICAIYGAVVVAVRLPNERLAVALTVIRAAVLAFALVAMSRGEWAKPRMHRYDKCAAHLAGSLSLGS